MAMMASQPSSKYKGLECNFLLCILITEINSITRHDEVESGITRDTATTTI